MIWNDAAVSKLKEFYKAGKSGSEIGRELGCGRNAVIGKISRLKLRDEGGAFTFRAKIPPPDHRKKKKTPRSRINYGYSGTPDRLEAFMPPEPRRPDDMKGCTLLQLTDKNCHFPIGDPREPGFHFCGNDAAGDGLVYCAYHARISYNPAANRRADNQGGASYGPQS